MAGGDQTTARARPPRRPGVQHRHRRGTSVVEIAKLLQQAAGKSVPIEFAPHRPGEQQESFVEVSKAREVLGWTPEVSLAEGLGKTYQWFARAAERGREMMEKAI